MSVGPIARIDKLRVEFATKSGKVVAVKDLSFDIAPGETVAVVGESGSGKSVSSLSLMRLVEYGGGSITQGKLLFDRGAERVDMSAIDPLAARAIRGNEIGMIFQEPMTALNPVFTVGKQLMEGLGLHLQMTPAQAQARALELLRQVRIPEPERRLRQYPHELSGGMRQRVVIAMALACQPKLLIADEPTTALDVTIQAEILALINRLKREQGTAVLFITHDMAVVAQMADRVVVMFRGEKVEEGPVEQIFAAPTHAYTQSLLSAVPRLGEMRGKADPEPLRLVGQSAEQVAPIPVTSDEVLLEVQNLTTRFPVKGGLLRRLVARVHAVEDVSFRLRAGETLSLVGESGCGKSTCGRSILRLVEPEAGTILLNGADVRAMDQRVAIARALALNPKLIIADEAVSALDVSVQAQVLNLMLALQRDLGISILFISHDMAVVERVSHSVGVMYLGRIVEIGPRRAIFENPQHPYTKSLLASVPIADPSQRQLEGDLNFKPIPSPIHPIDYAPPASSYHQVAPDHFILSEEYNHAHP